MIKVLHVVDHIDIKSGVSTFIMNTYRNINRNNIQFDFLVSNKRASSYEEEIRKLGGKIYYTENPLAIKSILSSLKKNKEFFFNHSNDYDVIHLHSPTISEMTVRYAKKYSDSTIIVHSHSTMFSNKLIKRVINRILTARILNYAEKKWYCSLEAGEFLFGQNNIKDNNSQWIKNSIEIKETFNLKTRDNVRERLGMINNKIACHVSNFSESKNVLFFVELIERVSNEDENWRFIFVGEGNDYDIFRQSISNKKLDKYCYFVGQTTNVLEYLHAADLFLLPSLKEGLPLVLLEAQSSGLPCIASSSITRQASIGLVDYLPLESTVWKESIIKFESQSHTKRVTSSLEFLKSDFNIENEILNIENLYNTYGE